MVSVHLHRITDSPNKLEKRLVNPLPLSGILNTDIDICYPTLRVKASNVVDYNYCYVPSLSRYYFIRSIDANSGAYYVLHLAIDVLMTYRLQIANLTGIVTNSDNSNPYINGFIDSYDVRKTVERLEFNSPFNPNGVNVLIGVKAIETT